MSGPRKVGIASVQEQSSQRFVLLGHVEGGGQPRGPEAGQRALRGQVPSGEEVVGVRAAWVPTARAQGWNAFAAQLRCVCTELATGPALENARALMVFVINQNGVAPKSLALPRSVAAAAVRGSSSLRSGVRI